MRDRLYDDIQILPVDTLMKRILVTGAGGFIGRYLVRCLRSQGDFVRVTDTKFHEYSPNTTTRNWKWPIENNSQVKKCGTRVMRLPGGLSFGIEQNE